MEGLVKQTEGTQLLIIDIDSWSSPVARQYKVNRLPQAWLYEGSERVSTDLQDVFQRLGQ